MVLNGKSKRLGIYHFYDKDGIVDRYVTYFLTEFRKFVTDLIIVCSCNLKENEQKKLEKLGRIINRSNEGLDIWSYKVAFEKLGWNKVLLYDEVILLNDTMMGPIYSFAEVFNKMNKKDVDFWGLTMYEEFEANPFHSVHAEYVPRHLQSYFIACRKSLVIDPSFQKYWENLTLFKNYQEAVDHHEKIFTKYFEDKGFKWASYIDSKQLNDISLNPIFFAPLKLIKDYRFPIFKKRIFFDSCNVVLKNNTGEQAYETFNFIKNNTNYDTSMILENLLRCYPHDILVKTLNFNYILSTSQCNNKKIKSKVALIFRLMHSELLEKYRIFIENMPKEADVYIITSSSKQQDIIIKNLPKNLYHKLDVIVIDNCEEDMHSVLIKCQKIINNYDVVCFAHDIEKDNGELGSINDSLEYKCLNNSLGSKCLVKNVIELFENNEKLGILCSPFPNHGKYFASLGNEWGNNYNHVLKLAQKLQINVPILKDQLVIAPYGNIFWFRPKAIKKLYNDQWHYDNYFQKNNLKAKTRSDIMTLLYPFIVQDALYYPGILMSDNIAGIEYQNIYYYLRTYQKQILEVTKGYYCEDIFL